MGVVKKKALIITTVSGFVPQFEMGNVRILQKMGYEVHYASNYYMPSYGKDNSRLDGTGIVRHQVDFVRSPFQIGKNIKAFLQLKKLQKEEKFQLVHCHTPMGGVLGRIVFGILGKKQTIIFYTAHGFHFYVGAPAINWLLYYPVEKFLSHWTDVLITLNKEDYRRAKKKFCAKKVAYVPGVGVESRFQPVQGQQKLRMELGIDLDDVMILSVGELNKNKNHKIIIQAMSQLQDSKIKCVICGQGNQHIELEKQAKKLGLEKQVKLLGYREDVNEIYRITDLFLFPSLHEGLPVALMEAMANGLPCIVSKIRGNKDLIVENKGGILCQPTNADEFAEALAELISDKERCLKMGEFNRKRVKRYDIAKVSRQMQDIYSNIV